MTYNSLAFLLFLPIATLIFWILPHKWRWLFLLAASLFVYMYEDIWFIVPITISSVTAYIGAILIDKAKKPKVKKACLIITISICLGILIFYKYTEFFARSILDIHNYFAKDNRTLALNIILPVGISFYTFQALAYVIDVYRGEFKAEKHFGYFMLFVTYFAQLVAGPIDRPDLIIQLRANNSFNKTDFGSGFRLLLCGYFRKCVVADICGIFVNSVFGNLGETNTLALLVAGLLFAIQVYSDFLGYSEIAAGAAKMMGVRLMRNFDRPFMATSIKDFMSRWHISLMTWFKDYVYIPLGGNRKGRARQCFNILFIYFLSGLWHGANWTFVLWGLYIGVFVIIEGLMRPVIKKLSAKTGLNLNSDLLIFLRRLIVILFFIPAALIFRSADVGQLGIVFKTLFTSIGFSSSYLASALQSLSMSYLDIIQVVLCIVTLPLVYYMGEYKRDKNSTDGSICIKGERLLYNGQYARKASSIYYIIVTICFAWLMLLAGSGTSEFVYFQF